MKKIRLFLSLLTCSILLTGCFDNNNPEVIDDCIIPEDCAIDESIDEDLSNKYFTAFWTEPFWGIEISWWIAKLSSPMFDTEYEEPVTITKEWKNYYFKWEELEGEFILKECIDWWKWDMHYYTVWVSKFREYYYEWCWDGEEWIKMSDEEYEDEHSEFLNEYDGFIKSCEHSIGLQLDQNVSDVSYGWYDHSNVWESYKIDWYVSYSLNGNFYTKDTTCTFQPSDFTDWWEFWNWEIEYWGFWNITTKSDEEQNCIDTLDQYPAEQMPWNPETIITVSCYPKDYYWPWYTTWYIYTSTYPDLWIRISTPAWWRMLEENSIFDNKSDKPIFVRNWNRISYIHPIANEEIEYIQVFEKSENESLKDIIERQYLNPNGTQCYIYEPNYYHQNKIFAPYPWTIIYSIESHWNSYESNCMIGEEDHNLVRFFESPDKTKYYEIDFGDWCAPWPCSIFGEVEVF